MKPILDSFYEFRLSTLVNSQGWFYAVTYSLAAEVLSVSFLIKVSNLLFSAVVRSVSMLLQALSIKSMLVMQFSRLGGEMYIYNSVINAIKWTFNTFPSLS